MKLQASLLLIVCAFISINPASAFHQPHRLRSQQNFAQTGGISGTIKTSMQDYCYYSFQDNAYRRCLDTDSDKLDSKGCTSGSDEIYQMIPSSITTYYYWRSKALNKYIKIDSDGDMSFVSSINDATRMNYQKVRINSKDWYVIMTDNLSDSGLIYRKIGAKRKSNGKYKITRNQWEIDGSYSLGETWVMYKQSTSCVAV